MTQIPTFTISRRAVGLSTMLLILALSSAITPVASAQFQPDEALAAMLARRANRAVTVDPLTSAAIDVARHLYDLALELDPLDAELRRNALSLARLSDDDRARRAHVEAMVAADPADDVLRLERINDVLDRYQTAEQLSAAYDRLLDPANTGSLGPPVASRLAFDAAILRQRMDDPVGFAERLSRAVALDPSNKAAAATAAGYFRMQINDPFAQGELLVNLLMADPTDIVSQGALARHLLEHGAYRGAARLHRLVIETYRTARRFAPDDLMADLALAQWASGDDVGARSTIRTRQLEMNAMARMQASEQRPGMTIEERGAITTPLSLLLSTVQMAMRDAAGEPPDAERLKLLREQYETMARAAEPPPAALRAEAALELAWLMVWLGQDADGAEAMLRQAEALEPLTDAARGRFDGWIALRRGDVSAAAERLTPLAESDPAAAAGLGLALRHGEDALGAMRQFAFVVSRTPGSVLGVWARHQLASLMGSPVAPSDLASALERLASTIPGVIDRLPTEPGRLVSLRVEPLSAVIQPHEPIRVRVTITNTAPFSLGIGSNAPIRPTLVIEPRLYVAGVTMSTPPPPVVVEITRRLRLEPREALSFIVDLSQTSLGDIIGAVAIQGSGVELRGTLNYVLVDNNAIAPGVLGATARPAPLRVEGVRVTPEWLDDALASIAEPDTPDDLVLMSLLAESVTFGGTRQNEHVVARADRIVEELARSFVKLDAVSQAWLIGVLPAGARLEPVRQAAKGIDHDLVRIVYLLTNVTKRDDPMLEAALRSERPRQRDFAEKMLKLIEVHEAITRGGASTTPQ